MRTAATDLRRPALRSETDRETALEASRAVARLTGRGAVRVEAIPVSNRRSGRRSFCPRPRSSC